MLGLKVHLGSFDKRFLMGGVGGFSFFKSLSPPTYSKLYLQTYRVHSGHPTAQKPGYNLINAPILIVIEDVKGCWGRVCKMVADTWWDLQCIVSVHHFAAD